jgi:hypothetical protein
MKYLTDYVQEKQTALFDKLGVFFAFSNKQLDEQKKEGVVYVSMGAGMICPKDNAKELHEGLNSIHDAGRAQDLAENGKKGVIHRELGNHEYSYTHDISDTVRALSGYGLTDEEIQAESAAYLKEYYEWEEAQEAVA